MCYYLALGMASVNGSTRTPRDMLATFSIYLRTQASHSVRFSGLIVGHYSFGVGHLAHLSTFLIYVLQRAVGCIVRSASSGQTDHVWFPETNGNQLPQCSESGPGLLGHPAYAGIAHPNTIVRETNVSKSSVYSA